MGYSKYPEEWEAEIRERLSHYSRFMLDHHLVDEYGKFQHHYFSWIFLDEPISNLEDVGSFKIYDPQSDGFYILLVD